MRMFITGDSFTYGEELADLTNSWPNLLAKKLDAKLTNTSQRGSSNQRIVYQTTKNFADNYDLFIIVWSEYSRFTFYKSDNNLEVGFTPSLTHDLYEKEDFFQDWGKTLYFYWHNELFAFKQWLQQIIHIQSLLDDKTYIMINTFPNNLSNWLSDENNFIDNVKNLINFESMNDEQILAEFQEIQYYISLIDTTKFYKWNDFYITSLCYNFKCGKKGHFLEEGHKHMAELIYNYV